MGRFFMSWRAGTVTKKGPVASALARLAPASAARSFEFC
jgi:hypothetical protein